MESEATRAGSSVGAAESSTNALAEAVSLPFPKLDTAKVESKGKGKARDMEDGTEEEDAAGFMSLETVARASPPGACREVQDGIVQPKSTGETLTSPGLAPTFVDFKTQCLPNENQDDDDEGQGPGQDQHWEKAKFSLRRPKSDSSKLRDDSGVSQMDGYFTFGTRSSPIPMLPQGATTPSREPAGSSSAGRQRPGHTRAVSSLGSSNAFDFFGPSSIASTTTVATSACFGSPRADSTHKMTEHTEHATEQISRGLNEARASISAGAGADTDAPMPRRTTGGSGATAGQSGSERSTSEAYPLGHMVYEPPCYPEESLPEYEEAPAYSPSLEGNDGATTPDSDARGFRAAAASCLRTSRLARRLRISGARQADIDPARTGTTNAPQMLRRPLSRSDSALEIPRFRRRPVVVQMFAASDFVQGARMGPAPRNSPRPPFRNPPRPSSRNSPAGSLRGGSSQQSSSSAVEADAAPSQSTGRGEAVRTLVSGLRDSFPRPASRPASRAGSYSGSTGGLFTCGYANSRSGASTPRRVAGVTKGRNLSLRDISDLLFHRERRLAAHEGPCTSADGAAASIAPSPEIPSTPQVGRPRSGTASSTDEDREAVEDVVAYRPAPTPSSAGRPSLLHQAHSSPQATVITDSAGPSPLVSSGLSREPNLFERMPRELILECFRWLIQSHIDQHHREVASGTWRGSTSTASRWVGADNAMRELARLSRVCRAWQGYVLDGQLWQTMEVSGFSEMSQSSLVKIGRSAAPFVKQLGLRGLPALSSECFAELFSAPATGLTAWTSLRELDLQGCTSLTTEALHQVLRTTYTLKKVNLSDLPCVNDDTCRILGETAHELEHLNVSRCPQVSGAGISSLVGATRQSCDTQAGTTRRNSDSTFKALRAAGIKDMRRSTFWLIGHRWPNLEELDLSYTDTQASFLKALVSSKGDTMSDGDGYHVALSSRQAGFESEDPIHRRVFPSLKKLNLSACRGLTDAACSYLAYAVPHLETLELSNIGQPLKDHGLLKLLPTVPRLRKLDLEGASAITDSVLTALTPPASHAEAYGAAPPPGGAAAAYQSRSRRLRRQLATNAAGSAGAPTGSPPPYSEEAVAALIPATGTDLTHLILSSANHLTVEAVTLLIQRCPKLQHIELDDTVAGDSVAKEFVHLAHQRGVQDAHISLIDCRGLTRGASQELASLDDGDAGTRPRNGRRGWAFRHFHYDDADAAAIATLGPNVSQRGEGSDNTCGADGRPEGSRSVSGPATAALRAALGQDECNRNKVVLKSFYAWQSVDARAKARKKAEAKAAKRTNKAKVSSVVAMAFALGGSSISGNGSGSGPGSGSGSSPGSSRGSGSDATRSNDATAGRSVDSEAQRDHSSRSGRWSRILGPVDSDDDHDDGDDDARGCVVA